MIPDELASRFAPLAQMSAPGATRHGVWRVRDRDYGRVKVLKCAAPHTLAPEPLLRHLHSLPGAAEHLLLPTEQGIAGSVGWSLTPWLGDDARDLEAALQQGEWGTIGRDVVGAFCRALALLHDGAGVGKQGWVLHGDIKPANVLVVPDPAGPPRVLLADFDGALLASESPTQRRPARFTPRQASPELMAGAPLTPAADWWSLGMLVAEAVLGRHPLEGLSEPALRSLWAGDWAPPLAKIEDTGWRALLGGLLQRDSFSRWGADKVGCWLAGDRAVWAEGLQLAGEPASAEPFIVAGMPVMTARDLARVALRHWQVIR